MQSSARRRRISALGPKSGSPGNIVTGTTQEGFLSRAIARPHPKGISSPLRGLRHRRQIAAEGRNLPQLVEKPDRVFRQAEAGHPVSDFPQHHLHRKQADRQQRRAEEHVSHVDLPPDLPVGEGGQQVEPPEAVVHRLVEQQRQGHVQPAL